MSLLFSLSILPYLRVFCKIKISTRLYDLQILVCLLVSLLKNGRFWKSSAKLLSIGSAVISRKFSIIHAWIIGFEASILPLRTSTTVGIVSSKLRNSLLWSNFLKFTYCKAKPLYLMIRLRIKVANQRFSKRLLKCEKIVMCCATAQHDLRGFR